MNNMHTIGVLGTGVWGCHSLERELLATKRCRVKCVCSRPEFGTGCFDVPEVAAPEYAAALGADFTDNIDDILCDPEIDIVSVMCCPRVKGELLLRVLAAGKSFVTDKPLAFDPATAPRIAEAERNASGIGCVLAGYHTRPAVAELLRLVQSGSWGAVKAISVRLNFSGGIYPGFHPSREWGDEISGGESVTIGSHAVMTAMKLAGAPVVEVHCVRKNDFFESYRAAGADDYALFLLKFANGAIADVSVGRLPYRITGEDIRVEVTAENGYGELRGTELITWPGAVRFDGAFNGADVLKMTFDRFLDAVEKRVQEPFTTVAEATELRLTI